MPQVEMTGLSTQSDPLTTPQIDKLFPYPQYRPYQREMLEFVYRSIHHKHVSIVNAPTGSGKSSIVAAALAASRGEKIIIAVRTISQLNIFATELERIRRVKYPTLKFAYLVGKGNVCPMKDSVLASEDVYALCDRLKKLSRDAVRKTDACMFYISAIGARRDGGSESIEDGEEPADLKAYDICTNYIHPDAIHDICGQMCPYEVMIRAARQSDVIIVNYHHIFSPPIRDALFRQLEITDPPIIIVDEAHNVGSTIEDINSLVITNNAVTRTIQELRTHKFERFLDDAGIDPSVVIRMARVYQEFLAQMQSDYRKYSNYRCLIDVDDLINSIYSACGMGSEYELQQFCIDIDYYVERWNESQMKMVTSENAKVDAVSSLKLVVTFTMWLLAHKNNPAYIKMFGKETESYGVKTYFKLWCIDPSKFLNALADITRAMVLMSGTISPTAMYADMLFGDREVDMLDVPFAFPAENRMSFCCTDVTSTYRERKNPRNVNTIYQYVRAMVNLRGNTAVFFTSYPEMNVYANRLIADGVENIYIEPKNVNDANKLLTTFMELPSGGEHGTLLGVCGGKFFEGIDYQGDALVGAMVVGLPLAPWDDVTKARNQYYINKFGRADGTFVAYTLPAVNRAQQALGRVLRTSTDIGVLVLCERRYSANIQNNDAFDGLSDWLQDEMREVTIRDFHQLLPVIQDRFDL